MKPTFHAVCFLCFTLCFQIGLNAQTTFCLHYPGGMIGNSVRAATNGDFIIAGGEDLFSHDRYDKWDAGLGNWLKFADIILMRTDAFGHLIWQKAIGTDSTRENASWMEICSDNGYIITGSSTRDKNTNVSNLVDSSDIFLMKTDENGNVLWSKMFDTGGGDERGNSVCILHDGGFLVSGFTDATPVSNGPSTRAILIRTDNQGNEVWHARYKFGIRDFTNNRPFPYIAKETRDHGIIVAGTTNDFHGADIYLMRLDSAGNVLWARAFDDSGLNFSGAFDVIEASDSSFIIAGFMDWNHMMGQNNYPCIMKVSSTGTLQAVKKFDYMSPFPKGGFSNVIEIPGQRLLFTGKSGYGEAGYNLTLLKTDLSLNLIVWSRVFNAGPVTGGPKSLLRLDDGTIVLAGINGSDGILLERLDSMGNLHCNTPVMMLPNLPLVNTTVKNPDTTMGLNSVVWLPSTRVLAGDSSSNCALSVLGDAGLWLNGGVTDAGIELDGGVTEKSDLHELLLEKISESSGEILSPQFVGRGHWLDSRPDEGWNYYRIRAIEADGAERLSEIHRVYYTPADHRPAAGPVPFHDQITLRNLPPGGIEIQVMNAQGMLMRRLISDAGTTELQLDSRDYSPGVFEIIVKDAGGQRTVLKAVKL